VEPWSRRVFFDTYGEYISINEDGNALDAPYTMLDAPTIHNMIGAILLSKAKSLYSMKQGNFVLKEHKF
jgi:hypothetical protein